MVIMMKGFLGRKWCLTVLLVVILIVAFCSMASADNLNVVLLPLHFIFNSVDKTPNNDMYFNGTTNVPAGFDYNGTVYVPLRFVSESLGKQVTWDGTTYTININDQSTPTNVSQYHDVTLFDKPTVSMTDGWQVDADNQDIYIYGPFGPTNPDTKEGFNASVTWNLTGAAEDVKGEFYVNGSSGDEPTYTYSILGDGQVLYTSDQLHSGTSPVPFDVQVLGVQQLTIKLNATAQDEGYGINVATGIKNLTVSTTEQ